MRSLLKRLACVAGALAFGFLARTARAASPYDAAFAALKELSAEQKKELGALVALPPGPAFLADARVGASLEGAEAALEAFRQAALRPNDGTLFAPKPEVLDAKTPVPQYAKHFTLFRLLLLDAKRGLARKERARAESDLLAAAGFLAQLSRQKSGAMISRLIEQRCLQTAFATLVESLREPSANPAYLQALYERLTEIERSQDFMKEALLEETAMAKGTIRGSFTPEAAAAQREKLSYFNRLGAARLQDAEFFTTVYSRVDAALNEQERALSEAFRTNEPAGIGALAAKRERELLERKQARDAVSEWSKVVDAFRGGTRLKAMMAEAAADTFLGGSIPRYDKLVPVHHAHLSELGALRAGLAVALYRRQRRRLPESLEELVPSFLPELPRDSFNGFQPLRYAKLGKKFVVYGFGPDGKDDRGATSVKLEGLADDPAKAIGDIVVSD